MKEYITIGQIINTHGVKGELKIYPLTDDIRRFRKLKSVFIDELEKEVIWCKLQVDKVILKLDGIESMDEAEKYKGKYIRVSRKDAVKLPEGRYFIVDIIGSIVYDENGKEIGPVYDVIQTGSNDVYWIKGENEFLIPAIKDVVVKMDIENKRIVIKPLEEWQ